MGWDVDRAMSDGGWSAWTREPAVPISQETVDRVSADPVHAYQLGRRVGSALSFLDGRLASREPLGAKVL